MSQINRHDYCLHGATTRHIYLTTPDSKSAMNVQHSSSPSTFTKKRSNALFFDQVYFIFLHPIKHWSDHDPGITLTKTYCFRGHKINFVDDLEDRRILFKVCLCLLSGPSRTFYKALNELLLTLM